MHDSRGGALQPLVRPRPVSVYIAAMGPRNLRLTGKVADGCLGNAFIPESADVFLEPLREGAESAERTLADLDLVAPVAVEFHNSARDSAAAARRHPTDTHSPSAPWEPAEPTSITTPSPGWGMANK